MRTFIKCNKIPLLVSLFIIILVSYLYWGGKETGLPPDPIAHGDEPDPEIEKPAAFTVGTTTNLIYQIVHRQCGHQEVLRRRSPSDEIGLTIEDLQAIYRDWTVEQTDSDVLLTADMEGLCPSCLEEVFVGIHEGKVAVFNGEPGGAHWIREVTEIPVEVLPPGEQADLEAGISVTSEEELLQILEGLMN